jgi:hypothetical protein
MDVAHELFDLQNDTDDETISGTVLRAKTSLVSTVMATQAKVEETALRRQTADRLPALLKLAAEVRAALPPLLELVAGQETPRALPSAGAPD